MERDFLANQMNLTLDLPGSYVSSVNDLVSHEGSVNKINDTSLLKHKEYFKSSPVEQPREESEPINKPLGDQDEPCIISENSLLESSITFDISGFDYKEQPSIFSENARWRFLLSDSKESYSEESYSEESYSEESYSEERHVAFLDLFSEGYVHPNRIPVSSTKQSKPSDKTSSLGINWFDSSFSDSLGSSPSSSSLGFDESRSGIFDYTLPLGDAVLNTYNESWECYNYEESFEEDNNLFDLTDKYYTREKKQPINTTYKASLDNVGDVYTR
jgi:hypothetical protein